MGSVPRIHFSHVGIHVHDIDVMADFYTKLLSLEITDRGRLPIPGNPQIVFLSSDPTEHHQIALVEGRRDGGVQGGVLNQLSFHVESLSDLRAIKVAAEQAGVERFMPLNHGTGWSIYFPDPEGNGIECFVASPWHVQQPVVDPLDLSLSDAEILERTQADYQDAPDFQPIGTWREAFARRIEARWSHSRS